MLGHGHRGHQYYRCRPKANNRGRLDRFPGHPATVYLREDVLLDAVAAVFNTCLFAEDGQQLDQIADTGSKSRTGLWSASVAVLPRSHAKQANLLSRVEDTDRSDPFTQELCDRSNDLETWLVGNPCLRRCDEAADDPVRHRPITDGGAC